MPVHEPGPARLAAKEFWRWQVSHFTQCDWFIPRQRKETLVILRGEFVAVYICGKDVHHIVAGIISVIWIHAQPDLVGIEDPEQVI